MTLFELRSLVKEVPWLLGVRPSSGQEDHDGVDMIVSTDKGFVLVQVVSSRVRLRWERNNPSFPGVVISIGSRRRWGGRRIRTLCLRVLNAWRDQSE